MNRHTLIKSLLMSAVPLLAGVAAAAQPGSAALDGKALFNEKCAMCHNSFGMGTGLLARRVDPAVAELEKRSDLTAAYVERAARVGILNITGHAGLEEAGKDLKALAGKTSVKHLKNSSHARRTTAEMAQGILAKLEAV